MRPSASYFFKLSLSLCCLCFVFLIPSILANHCFTFMSLFTPFSLLSSSPHFLLCLLISAPGTGIWKPFGFLLKVHIHMHHILLDADRCTMAWWRFSKMTTIKLWSRLIRRGNKVNASPGWVSVAQGWWCLIKGLSSSIHLLISSSPIVWLIVCLTYLCVSIVCVHYTKLCVRVRLIKKNRKREIVKETGK